MELTKIIPEELKELFLDATINNMELEACEDAEIKEILDRFQDNSLKIYRDERIGFSRFTINLINCFEFDIDMSYEYLKYLQNNSVKKMIIWDKICPKCDSTDVVLNARDIWKCRTCNFEFEDSTGD